MSTFRNPVGPQPASVYWRRRLVVGLGVLAVILVIILIVVRPGADTTPTGSQEPTPPSQTEDEGEEPDPAASGDPDEQCSPAVITVAPVTDKNNYAAGENPKIGLSITNNGAAACSFNVGTSQQELRITSGSELYWTSKHCQVDAEDNVIQLEPGVTQSTQLIEWDRTRSAEGSCGGDRPKVPAGGASYHLTVIVGEVESAETAQFLLH